MAKNLVEVIAALPKDRQKRVQTRAMELAGVGDMRKHQVLSAQDLGRVKARRPTGELLKS